MVDPSIALSYKPAEIDSPLDAYGKAMNLQGMANQQKIQQQEIEQRQIQLHTASALNKSIADNTKTNPDGTVIVDHDAVASQMGKAGFGAAGIEYADQQKKNDVQLKNLNAEQLLKVNDVQKVIADSLSSVRGIADPVQRQQAWTQKRAQAIQTFKADPNSLPEQVPDDNALAAWEATALDAHQRIQTRLQKQQADTQAQREKDYADYVKAQGTKADAYQDWMMRRGEDDNWKYLGISGGKAKLFNSKSGEIKDGGPIDESDSASGGNGKSVTPDAAMADRRANERDYETNAGAEIKYRQQKGALDSALNSGTQYVYPNGRVVSYSSMKQSDGSPLSPDDIKGYQDEMKQRSAAALTGIEQSVSNKNNAMQRNGVKPQVSTEQAINAYRGTPGGGDLPKGSGGKLDQATALKFLQAAGGDKAKARQLASQNNWKF